jgi:hypothetical protein
MPHLDKMFQEILQDVCFNNGGSVDNYSGRGMFGKGCLSISVRYGSEFDVISHIIDYVSENINTICQQLGYTTQDIWTAVANMIRDTRTDSLGKGIVVYWPDLSYHKNEEDED